MQIKATQWGNSLAIRIPKFFTEQIDIENGTFLEIELFNNQILISNPSLRLDNLLKGITKKNLHNETNTDNPVGKELW